MDYGKYFTRKIFTSSYQKQLRKENAVMKKRQMIRQAIIDLAESYTGAWKISQISTIEIQNEVFSKHNIYPSERHIQRIRKRMTNEFGNKIENLHKLKGNTMEFSKEEIDFANYVNSFSVKKVDGLMEYFQMTKDEVINTFNKMKQHIKNPIWDNEGEKFIYPSTDYMAEDIPNGVTVTVPDDGSGMVNDGQDHDDYWEVKIDCVTECSKVKKSVPVIISAIARKKVGAFMNWSGRREWLAYLVGKVTGEYEKVEVHDIYLPNQNASATLVDKVVAENYNQMSVVGVIHSHHEMGSGDEDNPSFSGHDAAFINSNHNVSLLVGYMNKKIKITGIVRLKTPCGSFIQRKAEVKAMKEEDPELDSLKKEFEEKVNGRTYNYQVHAGNGVF